MSQQWKTDCLHFVGHIPCKPHKHHGVHCSDCTYYRHRAGRILIIKLGATGDVIRTTPLLRHLMEAYPEHELWWISNTTEVLPSVVHQRIQWSLESVLTLESTPFDLVINLDKDPHACALMSRVRATERRGYTMVDGVVTPVDDRAVPKFLTGLFDDVNQANTLSYPEEIFHVCGFPWNSQRYLLDAAGPSPITLPSRKGAAVIGLNTGCGDRWQAREWPLERWRELIVDMMSRGYVPMLLGGPAEHDRNVALATATGATYGGTFRHRQFFGIVNMCDVVVTTVTMTLHAALGLEKRVVVMNNIFNPAEFELYGQGELIQPGKPCTCFFKAECTNPEYQCMTSISVDDIANAVERQLALVRAQTA